MSKREDIDNQSAVLVQSPAEKLDDAKTRLTTTLNGSIEWYAQNGSSRGKQSRWMRGLMILSGAVAVLIPLLTQIPSPIGIVISPIWASIAMVFTATLFAFEKYYGHAEAWMRFVVAKQELEKLKEQFDLAWLQLSLASEMTGASAQAFDELLRVSNERHRIVQVETEAWIKEFKNGMVLTTPTTLNKNSV